MNPKIDGLAVVGLALMLFLGASLLADAATAAPGAAFTPTPVPQEVTPTPDNSTRFAAPYSSYVVTQGVHGESYGHMAVDLAAKGDPTILSPISGLVSGLFTDDYGNPTLVIENELYQVSLLHGQYFVTLGQSVALGEPIGHESNLGYTTDLAGNPCWGRAGCGFHTHLNVFDKRLGMNVNPLDLLP